MKEESFDRLYHAVPVEQRERLRTFRATHPYRTLNVDMDFTPKNGQ